MNCCFKILPSNLLYRCYHNRDKGTDGAFCTFKVVGWDYSLRSHWSQNQRAPAETGKEIKLSLWRICAVLTQTDCLELVTTYGEISTLGHCYLIGPIRSEWLCDCWSLLFITGSFKVAGLHEIHVCRKIGVFLCIYFDSLIMLSVTSTCRVEHKNDIVFINLFACIFFLPHVMCRASTFSTLFNTFYCVFNHCLTNTF